MKLKQLLEEYTNTINCYHGKGNIYTNPSPKEIMKAAKEKNWDDKYILISPLFNKYKSKIIKALKYLKK